MATSSLESRLLDANTKPPSTCGFPFVGEQVDQEEWERQAGQGAWWSGVKEVLDKDSILL